ncbi:MAG: hypothetical protein Q7R73_02795 [bacterium]|nr:hypothetical protein [bacterium]
MAKTTIKRPDGTLIEISGAPEEIKNILSLYSDNGTRHSEDNRGKKGRHHTEKKGNVKSESPEDVVIKIVQEIRNGDQSEKIESNILEQSSQVDRVLLPLYIAKKYFGDIKMTSGDVYQVLKQLGVNMSMPNISKTLAKAGSKYVIPHNRRKRGESGQYTIALRGEKYISSLLE